ncbi:MAG TPA: hypothetical protein VF329_15695 [Gammaproteobacteria bacterium]
MTRAAAAAACVAVLAGACTERGPQQISDSGFGAFEASLAVGPRRLGIAWYDTRDGNAEIYLRIVDARTLKEAAELRLTRTADASYEADVAAIGDAFAVAWYEKSAEDGTRGARLGLWSDAGVGLWARPISSAPSRNPVLAVRGDAMFSAWIEADGQGGEAVWAAWWSRSGERLGEPIRVGPASATTWNLNAAVDAEGRAFVVYDAQAGTRAEEILLARVVDDGGASLMRLTADDGYRSKYPDIAFGADGTAAITWFDERDGNTEVYFYAGALGPDPAIERAARRVTQTTGDSIGAYVASNGSTYGLVWSDDTAGAYDVFFQAFDAAGVPLSSIRRVSSTAAQSLIPSIGALGERFAVAWNEIEAASLGHGAAQRSEVLLAVVP